MFRILSFLLILIPFTSFAAPINFATDLIGTLGKKTIKMHLISIDGRIQGFYGVGDANNSTFIFSKNRKYLSGSVIDNNQLKLTVFDAKDQQEIFQGRMEGVNSKMQYKGQWQKEDNGQPVKTLSFDLKKNVVSINQQTLQTQFFQQTNSKQFFTLQINHPQLVPSTSKQGFNQAVQKIIQHHTKSFLKSVDKNTAWVKSHHVKGMPALKPTSNSLYIDYEVMYANSKLISLRFKMSSFYYGMAHPNTFIEVLNYDLKNNKSMTLASVFNHNKNFLRPLASYVKETLTKRLIPHNAHRDAAVAATRWIEKGAAPKVKNYENWNFVPGGVVISFNPYQVAAYVFGPQTVFIPQREIDKINR